MRKALFLLLAFAVFTGFKWGGGDEADEVQETRRETTAYRTSQQAASATQTEVPETGAQSGAVGLSAALNAGDPDTLKQRIESLARVGRALRALNETRRGGEQPVAT